MIHNSLEPIKLQPLPPEFRLRPVQDKALSLTRLSIGRGNRKVIIHIPPAGGKTVLAGMIFYLSFQKDPTCQCLFVVNRNTLLLQTKKEFEKFFGFDCGIIQGDYPIELHKHVQITTIQTLHLRLTSDKPNIWNEFNRLTPRTCVIDEAHLTYKGYQTISKSYDPIMIGLSGTPFSKGMGKFWQDMVRPETMVNLIKDGTLCDYRVRACVQVNRENLGVSSSGEYVDKDVEEEVGRIIGDVYTEWKASEDMQGRPFIGFTKNIATTIALSETFTDQGERVAYVHSKMSDKHVQAVLDAFMDGEYIGVFSVVKLIEGFNFPEVSALIMCAPLAPSRHDKNIPNSCNRYVQQPSRGLRSHPEKGYCLIHDHVGNFKQYGAYERIEEMFPQLDDGKTKKVKLTAAERVSKAARICGHCGMEIKGSLCDYCGHKPEKPTQFLDSGDLEFINGKMVELKKAPEGTHKQRRKEMDWPAKIKVYGQFKQYCIDKGKKDGYAAHCWKSFMGTWPNDPRFKNAPPIPVGENIRRWIQSRNIAYAKKIEKERKQA